jgi:hypothetical protein
MLGSGCQSCLCRTVRWVPFVREKWLHIWHLTKSFSLLNLLSVIHLKWIVDSGVFISLSFIPKFPCGTNRLFPEFSNDFFWLVDPLSCLSFPFLWFITDNWYLSLIVHLLYFLRFFKSKQLLMAYVATSHYTDTNWSNCLLNNPTHP